MADAEPIRFAHPSEAQFADLLDAFGVHWEYEPAMFVLDEFPDGSPREAFTPDFYLPDFDLFVELTTLRPALATVKRRKIRRFEACHPGSKVLLVDRTAYRELVARFGLVDHAGAPASPVFAG